MVVESDPILEKIQKIIEEFVPRNVKFSVELEGPEIALYTKDKNFIGENREIIKRIVKK